MYSIVNMVFERILPGKENSDILQEAVDIEKFRKEIVTKLALFEQADNGNFWWQNKELMGLVDSLYKSGCILLPRGSIERLRWTAILLVAACNQEGFSCGNVIIPPDFLPDQMIDVFEDQYGFGVIENIRKIRKEVSERGWDAIFS